MLLLGLPRNCCLNAPTLLLTLRYILPLPIIISLPLLFPFHIFRLSKLHLLLGDIHSALNSIKYWNIIQRRKFSLLLSRKMHQFILHHFPIFTVKLQLFIIDCILRYTRKHIQAHIRHLYSLAVQYWMTRLIAATTVCMSRVWCVIYPMLSPLSLIRTV